MTRRRNDALRISDILRSVERLQELLSSGYETFSQSWMSQSAAIRELEIIGEAARETSSELRRRFPELGWARMGGFSSFAKHEYWRIRPELVWDAIKEMPRLRGRLRKVVPTE